MAAEVFAIIVSVGIVACVIGAVCLCLYYKKYKKNKMVSLHTGNDYSQL